ncbi:hypothetical protein SAMN04489832_0261 [Micromonospora cremea]|uniref:Uncharacterized protein n=1 Tax=Micromonospora cremea TaxID=709881 RepID=A0A1N5TNG5_9ACTN|nr:hypothetical protein SAMN04489832_0261 [Micromonospora cremea]
MPHCDTISRWITATTDRTLDQHAADPVPAAAHLPEAAAICGTCAPSCCSRWTGCAPY